MLPWCFDSSERGDIGDQVDEVNCERPAPGFAGVLLSDDTNERGDLPVSYVSVSDYNGPAILDHSTLGPGACKAPVRYSGNAVNHEQRKSTISDA
jgi:hypothetical protein